MKERDFLKNENTVANMLERCDSDRFMLLISNCWNVRWASIQSTLHTSSPVNKIFMVSVCIDLSMVFHPGEVTNARARASRETTVCLNQMTFYAFMAWDRVNSGPGERHGAGRIHAWPGGRLHQLRRIHAMCRTEEISMHNLGHHVWNPSVLKLLSIQSTRWNQG